MCQAQLLGEKLPPAAFALRPLEMLPRMLQRTQMALTGQEHRFATRGPARCLENPPPQGLDAGTGLRGNRMRALGGGEARREVNLVIDLDTRDPRWQILQFVPSL